MYGIDLQFSLHTHEHTRRDRQESTLVLIETVAVVVVVAGGVMEVEVVQDVLVFIFYWRDDWLRMNVRETVIHDKTDNTASNKHYTLFTISYTICIPWKFKKKKLSSRMFTGVFFIFWVSCLLLDLPSHCRMNWRWVRFDGVQFAQPTRIELNDCWLICADTCTCCYSICAIRWQRWRSIFLIQFPVFRHYEFIYR